MRGRTDGLAKQLYQMEDVSALMLGLADSYQSNAMMQKIQDSICGEDATAYIGQAIQAFYKV